MDRAFHSLPQSELQSETTSQENLLQSPEYLSAVGKISIPFGKTDSGEVIVPDLDSIPHMLICGNLGTGKTAFVRTILSVICKEYSSFEVKIMIYDAKCVEYLPLKNNSHLLFPIITDLNEMIEKIGWLCDENRNRLHEFANLGCKDLVQYNDKCSGIDGYNKKPVIFAVFDEYASMRLNKENNANFHSLIMNGRLAGIHIIVISSLVSTSSAQKELLSVIPCKVSFRLSSKSESKNVLGIYGAEELNTPGEMIYKYQHEVKRCSSAYTTLENIENALKSDKGAMTPIWEFGQLTEKIFADIPTLKKDETRKSSLFGDELFEEAGLYIIRSGKVSIGYLQRVLKIGFNRAAHLIDELEDNGVIGREQGTKPRDILMTEDMFKAFLTDKANLDPSFSSKTQHQIRATKALSGSEKTGDEPDIPLRYFPRFRTTDTEIAVVNNHIILKKDIMTKRGPGKLTSEFAGCNIEKIILKKNTFFSKGYFTFGIKSSTNIKNNDKELLHANHGNLSEVLMMEFVSDSSEKIWEFLSQISEDTGIPITIV